MGHHCPFRWVQLSYPLTRKPGASLQSSGLEHREAIIFNYKNVTFVFTEVIQGAPGHCTGRCVQMKGPLRRGCSGLVVQPCHKFSPSYADDNPSKPRGVTWPAHCLHLVCAQGPSHFEKYLVTRCKVPYLNLMLIGRDTYEKNLFRFVLFCFGRTQAQNKTIIKS